jgi:hypothetical protein
MVTRNHPPYRTFDGIRKNMDQSHDVCAGYGWLGAKDNSLVDRACDNFTITNLSTTCLL